MILPDHDGYPSNKRALCSHKSYQSPPNIHAQISHPRCAQFSTHDRSYTRERRTALQRIRQVTEVFLPCRRGDPDGSLAVQSSSIDAACPYHMWSRGFLNLLPGGAQITNRDFGEAEILLLVEPAVAQLC